MNKLSYLSLKKWKGTLMADVIAGCSVGILSIPLSIALAVASGLSPQQGLFAAFIGGLISGVFGGCAFQISGPTGTLVVLLLTVMQKYSFSGVVIMTLLSGLMLIGMGLARLGRLIKFIPYPVVRGFTSGTAVLLMMSQLPDAFGLQFERWPQKLIAKCWVLYEQGITLDPFTLSVTLVTMALMWLTPKFLKRIPGALMGIIIPSVIVALFSLPVITIQDRFGAMSGGLPKPLMIAFEWHQVFDLIPSAFVMALLIGMESLFSALIADGMSGRRHRPNKELIAQGLGNMGSILFGGMPCAGSVSRTVLNIREGARSPLSMVVSVGFIGLLLWFCMPLIAYIPVASLAGLLFIIAYNNFDWKKFGRLFRSSKSDLFIMMATFLLVIFVNAISALEIGIILSTFLFVEHASNNVKSLFIKNSKEGGDDLFCDVQPINLELIPESIEVFELSGPLFFAAVDHFNSVLHGHRTMPQVLIIRMRYVPWIDASGIMALEGLIKKYRKKGVVILFSGVCTNVRETLQKSGLYEKVGSQAFFVTFSEALRAARELVQMELERV